MEKLSIEEMVEESLDQNLHSQLAGMKTWPGGDICLPTPAKIWRNWSSIITPPDLTHWKNREIFDRTATVWRRRCEESHYLPGEV